jgi:asparagine synthase (glutamine-hydrolysing)
MVDIAVLRALAPLLANRPMDGKRVLGEVPVQRVPDALLERPKTGFAVPVHEWVSPPKPGAPRRSLSMGLRHWALRLVREFDLVA